MYHALQGVQNALDLLQANVSNVTQDYFGLEHNVVIPNVVSAQESPQMNALSVTLHILITKMELAKLLVLLLFKAQLKALRHYAMNPVSLENIITALTKLAYQNVQVPSLLTLIQAIISFIASIHVTQLPNISLQMAHVSTAAHLFSQAAKSLESNIVLTPAHHLPQTLSSPPMELVSQAAHLLYQFTKIQV